MKSESFLISATWIITACFLIGGCDNTQEKPSTQSAPDELNSSSQLAIRAGDSLMFTPVETLNQKPEFPDTTDSTSIKAYSFIEPAQSLGTIKTYQPGTLLHFSLDENLTISVRINRNQPVGDDIRTLTGQLMDPHSGNIVLSIDEDIITGSIDLFSENRLFHIRYDRVSGNHYLAEIDRSKLDILEGSEPLEY